jgi:hypothetical protein
VMTWGTREIAKPPRTWKSMTSQVGTTNFWRHEMGKYVHTKCLLKKKHLSKTCHLLYKKLPFANIFF